MSAWLTVFAKECIENARDRRVLASALLYGPLVGPVLFAVMLTIVLSQHREEAEKPLQLPVIGAEHAPSLIDFLRANGARIQAGPDDPEAAIAAQRVDLVLRIDPGYAEAWTRGAPAPVDLLHDRSRQKTQVPVERARELLQRYAATHASLRLRLRGVDPVVTQPLRIRDRDLSTEQSRAGLMLGMLPYLLILSAFIGGMYLAIDTTAGERERRSLEPLFLAPVGRGQLLAGKFLCTALYAAASLAMSVLAFAVSVRFIPAAELGMNLHIPAATIARILLVTLPVAALAAIMQMLVCSFARSFREAQTYAQFLMFVPMIPSLVLVINPLPPALWMMCVPLFSQSVLITALVRGESVELGYMMLSLGSTALACAAFGLLAWYLFTRERFVLAG